MGVASKPGRAFWGFVLKKEFGDHQMVEGSVVLKKGFAVANCLPIVHQVLLFFLLGCALPGKTLVKMIDFSCNLDEDKRPKVEKDLGMLMMHQL